MPIFKPGPEVYPDAHAPGAQLSFCKPRLTPSPAKPQKGMSQQAAQLGLGGTALLCLAALVLVLLAVALPLLLLALLVLGVVALVLAVVGAPLLALGLVAALLLAPLVGLALLLRWLVR